MKRCGYRWPDVIYKMHSFALAVRGGELDIPTGETTLVAVVENEALRICAVLIIGFDRLVGFVDSLHLTLHSSPLAKMRGL